MEDDLMQTVSREEKLILQMKNIEAMVSDPNLSAEQRVFMVTQQMSYLNQLVNALIEPFREETGDSELVKLANSTFQHFIDPKEGVYGDSWMGAL
jgi:hypothetical protein